MPREVGSKNLTDKEKKAFNRKRKAVIRKMPRTYNSILNNYYEIKGIDPLAVNKVRTFMNNLTYSEEVLKVLTDFTENFLSNNQ